MTVLTDLLLAGWAFYLGMRLRGGVLYRPRLLWSWALIMTAVAAFTGGLWHGYAPYWNFSLAAGGWKALMVFVGLADALFAWAIVSHCLQSRWQGSLCTLVALKLAIYLLLLLWVDGFWLAVADYLPTLLLILFLQVPRLRHARDARWLTVGVLTALAAAGVQLAEVPIHSYFNHNDLYHLIQGVALYFLYRGGRLFTAPEMMRSANSR